MKNITRIVLQVFAFFVCLHTLTTACVAADQQLKIALIEYSDDPRYKANILESRYQAQPWGRLSDAAVLAVKESRFAARSVGVDLEFVSYSVGQIDELPMLLKHLEEDGVHLFLLDLPASGVRISAESLPSSNNLMFNLSALDNSLRSDLCRSNLLHISPSRAMLTDAMAQFLVVRKWEDILVLFSTGEENKFYLNSLHDSGKKYGLNFVAENEYILGNDPRQRYRNNIALLTGKHDYDAVFVVDDKGEFAVNVPFATLEPRPVIGAAGLVADWWHWSWDRNGAPQVNKRFLKAAKRQMTGYDWTSWLSIKIISEALLRTKTVDVHSLATYIKSDLFKIDGAKGYPLNFRAWNNQLRQPIFLSSLNRVIEIAPLTGFLHPINNLDVLGEDSKDSPCQLAGITNK